MNLLYDIDPGTADEMNVIVEVPKGSQNKYEIDKATGVIALDRANYSAAAYPCEYGFVPQTLWDDVQDLADINKHTLRELQHFFETYKHLKGKPAEVVI